MLGFDMICKVISKVSQEKFNYIKDVQAFFLTREEGGGVKDLFYPLPSPAT